MTTAKKPPKPGRPQTSESTTYVTETFDEFEGFGLSNQPDIRPLHERCIAFAAEPGVGKSTLAQSEPNAIVIDVDQAGLVNPHPRAMLAPGVGQPISVPHPLEPEKRVTSMGFDYVRAIVKRAVEIKKQNPDRPLVIWIDTVSSLIEARIRKLEADVGKPFDMMDGRRVWPAITRNVTDLIDECKAHRIGTRLCFHITKDKVTRQFYNSETKRREEVTISERSVNIAPSMFKSLTQRFDEGMVLKTRIVKENKTKTNPSGKKIIIGETETKMFSIEVDKDSEFETIRDFSKTKIMTLPRSFEWEDGNVDAWVGVVAPGFEKAIEEFKDIE